MEYSSYNVNTPQWREITVGSHLPAELRKLAEIAHNLWLTWKLPYFHLILRGCSVPVPFYLLLLHGCPEAFQLSVRTYDRNLVIWIEMFFPLWYI